MKHSLIVGLGLAGLAYAEQLRRAGLSFHIIDGGRGGSSQIAAGIYNPTVLKRFSLSWNGDLFHSYALPFYEQLQSRLDSNFIHPHQFIRYSINRVSTMIGFLHQISKV